ncbi:hypothetical protein C8R48DRAFT_672801 [Suillus tomentosus]|nr:hypothetical protein C8R48DRAFT_672801 [Suillus tomentosus]
MAVIDSDAFLQCLVQDRLVYLNAITHLQADRVLNNEPSMYCMVIMYLWTRFSLTHCNRIQKVCDTCGRSFKPKGFDHHQRACEQRARESEEDGELWASIPPVQVAVPALTVQGQAWNQDHGYDHDNDYISHYNTDIDMLSDRHPWLPFRCQLDFEVAELAHETTLTHEQMMCLIQLVQSGRTEDFTLKNYADVRNTWEAASHRLTPSQIPPEAKPLAFILYADKSELSSFGREKGYPIIARLANLPVAIRNGNGVGGGRVVGWLPLVKDDLKHKGTQQFANFKVAVWHAAFKTVLASIIPPSKHGHWANCWDDVVRLFYTLVLILSADYEERSVMSLTRGMMSNFPCQICLIPEDKLSSVMPHNYTLRTCQATNDLLIKARAERCKGQWEAILKKQSIHDVDNTFHEMNCKTTDVHRALCYDRLHIVLRSLFGDHMWPELQVLIGLLGHDFAVKVDQNFDALPRWCNINHFDAVMAITFTDGSKYKDIFKAYVLPNQLIVFAAHDILLNTDESLEVHTMKTIAAGREALQSFSELVNKYIHKSEALWPDKNWSFPKIHLAAHLFDDIEAKGATCNYNTKPNEKCHDELAAYDAWMDEDEVDKTGLDTNITSNFHIRFGSKKLKKRFCTELNAFLNALPTVLQQVNMLPSDKIIEFQFLKVNYESLVDFCQAMDYLHCSPRFHNLPQYDCVIVNTVTESIIQGVALAPDPTIPGDFLVMDTIDSDIFLRMKQMHLAAGHLD